MTLSLLEDRGLKCTNPRTRYTNVHWDSKFFRHSRMFHLRKQPGPHSVPPQLPLQQTPVVQTLPQLPQFVESLIKSVHCPKQHAGIWPVQTLPHEPQLVRSLLTFVQRPLQKTKVLAHRPSSLFHDFGATGTCILCDKPRCVEHALNVDAFKAHALCKTRHC